MRREKQTDRFYSTRIAVRPPFVVFAATDGCYGYVSTPMEFEGMVLNTLMNTASVAQWEQTLADTIGSIAGDDHSLSMAAVGCGSFEQLKHGLLPRYEYLWNNYVAPLQGAGGTSGAPVPAVGELQTQLF